MQQWKQDNAFWRDPYDDSHFTNRPRKRLKTLTDWKELSQICSSSGKKVRFLLKNRAAITKTITFLPSVLRLDDIEEFSEERNQPLPTTTRPTHNNIHIKNEPNTAQLHVSFAAEIRSSPGPLAHRPVLVKKERTPHKSILKNNTDNTSNVNNNSTSKKRKRSDQIQEIYTDSVIDDYDISDSIMHAYSYDDINLHNIEAVCVNNKKEKKIKNEPILDQRHSAMYNNTNSINNGNSDVNTSRHEPLSEMSRVPDSFADVILAKDSQPLPDLPTPSPHLSLALGSGEERVLSQPVDLIPSQIHAHHQRSSTSLGTMSHVSDSISHPSITHHHTDYTKRIDVTYVDSQRSAGEEDHISVEESQADQPSTNNKLLQDSYDDDAEVLNGNLLGLKRARSNLLSTKRGGRKVEPVLEVPLSTQGDEVQDIPATLSYHSNINKESETQKQIANTYTFVSLNNKNSNNNNESAKKKPVDVVEVSSQESDKNNKNKKDKLAVKQENQYDDSLDDFDVVPKSAKKTNKSNSKTKEKKSYNSSGSSNDSNKTIVLEGKQKKKNKKNKNKTKVSITTDNQNLKLLLSQSDEDSANNNNSNMNSKIRSIDASDLESNYAIYMPSSDDFM